MERGRYGKTKITLIIVCLVMIGKIGFVVYDRFYIGIDDKLSNNFNKNKEVFFHLKDKTFDIALNKADLSEKDLISEINRELLTDSLREHLHLNYINISIVNNDIIEIMFSIEMQNYIGPFKYIYNVDSIREFSTNDGLCLEKIDGFDNWGIMRDKRRYGLVPIYE